MEKVRFLLMKNDNLNVAKSLKTLLAQLQGSIDGDFSKYAYMTIEDALADAFKDLEKYERVGTCTFFGTISLL